ncbi:MAG: SpaA isopeptide-forming pilin-related protein, partial [Candidatus Faecousia sp.]|nr:SpaA isopeptide-forming pilin-related protein [Candidatus Faecousia sp.]
TESDAPAYNLESRGVIEFTKTGSDGALDTHAGADGESKAYFGVYTDATCTNQVAGMMADDTGITMVLTTLAQDGITDRKEEFLAKNNAAGLPYLRLEDGQLTLLSGTYYIQEEIAPPGYKLDTTVRMAVIPLLEKNSGETAYSNNRASILIPEKGTGTADYQWVNVPNQLTLYKRDQYGRPVTLKDGGWLELKVEGEGNTFLTGENTIRLYQNSQNPAAKLDGAAFDAGKTPNITYDSDHWTITGLFDIGKTYTISEPEESVPGSHIQAKPFSFTMKADGSITYAQFEGRPELVSMDNPLEANGTNFENAFRSNTGSNVVVLRDVARFLKDVALEKINSVTNAMIPNISFKLYKYSGKDADGNPQDVTSALETDKFLTTNENGMIDLKDTNGYINQVTGCGLEYGLDVGEYYFEEIERGASDIYRLADKVYFEITPKEPTNPTDYQDYAKVTFDAENGFVTQPKNEEGQLGKMGVVSNTPVTQKPKTLALTKVDSTNNETKLSGAQFTLTYTSVNDKQTGAQEVQTDYCITDSNGVLRLRKDNSPDGEITSAQPDISKKGTYTLVETLAPYGYMTRTDGNGNPVTMVTFEVDSANQITNVTCGNGLDALVSHSISPTDGEHTALNLTVKNEKTVVSIAKRNDIESDSKTSNQKSLNGEPLTGAVLEIYEGIGTTGTKVADWTSPAGDYQLPAGTLKENTIYTLHEKEAPVGYLEADDIYFKLFGTTVKNGNVVSQLYVWTGNGEPALKGEWSKTTNLNDTVLTMVDEAVIAPVDLQKVVGDAISGYTALLGAVFEVRSLDGEGTVLGTAATNETGHLVWQTVTNPNGLIFNASGKRVTSGTDSSVIGKTIILRQNTNGYQFTETYAPDQAYNEGKSFTVKITAKNYTDYRVGGYRENVYVDILAANKMDTKTVENLTTRDNTPTADDLVNPPYKSTVTLHKYDGESGEARTPLEKTEFTLYRVENDVENLVTDANVPGGEPNASGKFVTGEDGDLSIEIHRKGDYILRETQAAPGYICDGEVSFTLTDADYGQKKAEPGDAGKVAYEVPNV